MSVSASSAIERIGRLVHRFEDALLVILLGGLVGLSLTQIILRNLWQTSLSWGDPLLRLMVLWVGLLGAMAATREANHIRIDLLARFMPPVLQRLGQRLTNAFAGASCALLAWHSARFVRQEWESGSLLLLQFPSWLAEIILPLGFGIMAIRFFLQTLNPPRSTGTSP